MCMVQHIGMGPHSPVVTEITRTVTYKYMRLVGYRAFSRSGVGKICLHCSQLSGSNNGSIVSVILTTFHLVFRMLPKWILTICKNDMHPAEG